MSKLGKCPTFYVWGRSFVELLSLSPPATGGRHLKPSQLLLCAGIGALVFLVLYGPYPLLVTQDLWVLNGYAEPDITQNYAGWMAFRRSAWAFPLGSYEPFGGGLISFTDSIPWAALLCKLLSPLLPETFQYFGLYVLLCFVLQGLAAGMLIRQFSAHRGTVYGGCLLFCLAPILLERAFRHCGLASHFLILFSLYLLFDSRESGRLSWKFGLLSLLAVGVHPYFLPMIYAILLANLLYLLPRGKRVLAHSLVTLVLCALPTLAAGYAIGVLGTSAIASGSYGFYCMNLNALVNPISCSKIIWSRFLPVQPMILGNYDGFNYLGLGLLVGLPFLLVALVRRGVGALLRRYWGLAAVCLVLLLFAISNTVTFQDRILLEVPLPQPLFQFASIFRASARMFYPISYLIMLGVLIALDRCGGRRVLLVALLVVQLVDLSPALAHKFQSLRPEHVEATYAQNCWYADPVLNALAGEIRFVYSLNPIADVSFGAWGMKNGMDMDVIVANRVLNHPVVHGDPYWDKRVRLLQGPDDPSVAFVTNRPELALELLDDLPEQKEILPAAGYYFIVDKRFGFADLALKK